MFYSMLNSTESLLLLIFLQVFLSLTISQFHDYKKKESYLDTSVEVLPGSHEGIPNEFLSTNVALHEKPINEIISHHLPNAEAQINYRVAFVFAGSPRSFMSPTVRLTIKKNLLDAFCPPPYCMYDVFARASINDNTHVGAEANGRLSLGDENLKSNIVNALEDLRPPKDSGGQLFLQLYGIGSTEENEFMIKFGGSDFRQKMYRELDPRRYSMYFGRWAAYDMAMQQEKTSGLNYTWIVHARFDAAWGAPISPVHEWNQKYIYGPDTWWADIPDTFALLPRNLSEKYYSMHSLVKHRVMCLGGPNFDPLTLEREYLKNKLGYTDDQITIVQGEDCKVLFPGYGDVPIKPGSKLTWSPAGYSEYILGRKMASYGYDIQKDRGKGVFQLATFYMFVVRSPLMPLCNFLFCNRLLPWVKSRQASNAAMEVSCKLFIEDVKKFDSSMKDTTCRISNDTVSFDKPESKLFLLCNDTF